MENFSTRLGWAGLAALLLSYTAVSQQPDSIVWSFDRLENIGGHRTTILGQPKVIDTPLGKAVEFDGVDDALFIDNHPLAGAQTFTLEAIFRPDGGQVEQRWFHLSEKDPATGADTDNRMLFEIRVAGDQWFLDSFNQSGRESKALMNRKALHPLGAWHHVATVYDGKEFRNYVDGVQEGAAELHLAPHGAGHTSVGVRINKVFYFKGAVHRARFTRRALPVAEFLQVPRKAVAADWPQFRGPNASGVAEETNLPSEFGPDKNVVWRTALPTGYSSPSVAGDKIFLTAIENEKLSTIALDRTSGRILWRREAPRPRKQELQPNNGPASPTPSSDGRNVYVFFADFGLLAYGPDGNELWRMALGPFNNPFGHGASPILAGDTLLMVCDQDAGSFLLALDKNSGRVLWRLERPLAQRGYATPVLYKPPDGPLQVLVAGSYRLTGYDLRTGKEIWWVRGLPWQVKPTPIVAGDVVYFVTYSGESDPGEQEIVPPFTEALAQLDTNKDGKLSKDEIVDPRAKNRFDEYLDLDDSGFLEERDWKQFQERRLGENSMRAYRLRGEGDVTERNLIWKNPRSLPNVPSPLYYRGVLYTLKEGGIFTSFDTKTGDIIKQARLQGAIGAYYSSPVAADGKIYAISEEGKAVVIRAGAQWEVLGVNDLKDGSRSTPAIAGGRLYLRTYSALYCFAQQD